MWLQNAPAIEPKYNSQRKKTAATAIPISIIYYSFEYFY